MNLCALVRPAQDARPATRQQRWIVVIPLLYCVSPTVNAFEDIVRLKDGRQINGSLESSSGREVQIRAGEFPQVIPLDLVQSIQFDPAGPASPMAIYPAPTIATPTFAQTAMLPSDTEVTIRTTDRIDSKTANRDTDYVASVDENVLVNGTIVIPAKSNAFLRVTVTKPRMVSMKPRAASVGISLVAVSINGKRVELTSEAIQSKGPSHFGRDVAVSAAAGAGIGAIFGGAVGAGVGAGIGVIGGAIYDKISGHVVILPETRFSYRLPQALVITYPGVSQ